MEAKETAYKQAAQLYCLALLLTGDSELSVNLVLEAIDLEDTSKGLFTNGRHASWRNTFTAKALACVRHELTASATRLASARIEEQLPPPGWSFDPSTTKAQIEHVLLAIDIFPRCALILTALEGLNLDEASNLMSSHPELVLKGRITGLLTLTRSFAKRGSWYPLLPVAPGESELPHAC